MVYSEYNALNNIICLCTNNNTLIVILKLHHHNIIPQYKTVQNKTTISFNSSMLTKRKSPESSFIHKSLIKIAENDLVQLISYISYLSDRNL